MLKSVCIYTQACARTCACTHTHSLKRQPEGNKERLETRLICPSVLAINTALSVLLLTVFCSCFSSPSTFTSMGEPFHPLPTSSTSSLPNQLSLRPYKDSLTFEAQDISPGSVVFQEQCQCLGVYQYIRDK